jgi:peptide methionine sulfoxide reductase msrA/msrB
VCSHTTGHAEAVELEFNPEEVSYETLLRHFFRLHDPTQLNRQGPDVGDQYRSAIFYTTDDQKAIAEQIRDEIQVKTNDRVVTQIVPATEFYSAEDYHQKFTERTGRGMCHVEYAPI